MWIGCSSPQQNPTPSFSTDYCLAEVLQSATPITDNDKEFVRRFHSVSRIDRQKIKFTEDFICLGRLKFSRKIVTYTDVEDISWLKLGTNVYDIDLFASSSPCYFTAGGVKMLQQAWKNIPTQEERNEAADIVGWKYFILEKLLDYPKVGICRNSQRQESNSAVFLALYEDFSSDQAACIFLTGDLHHDGIFKGQAGDSHAVVFVEYDS